MHRELKEPDHNIWRGRRGALVNSIIGEACVGASEIIEGAKQWSLKKMQSSRLKRVFGS